MTISRRTIVTGSMLAGAAPWLAQAQTAAPKLEDAVVIRTTGGVFEAALKRNFFDPFTKATGVRVVPVAASDSEMQAKAAAMQAAGRVEWDIISPQMSELPNLARLLVDLGDCSSIPAVASQPARHVRPLRRAVSDRGAGPGLQHRVPFRAASLQPGWISGT